MTTAFERYLELLLAYNAHTNLTAIREPEAIRIRHFEDSLYALKACDAMGKRLLDLGSGAGFPGMALAIAEPSMDVTLVEANGKKTAFLSQVQQALGVSNVTIIQGRGEELAHLPLHRERYDLVTARGVASMDILCEIALPFLKINGILLAFKENPEAVSNAEALGGASEAAYHYTLSDGRSHCILPVRKTAPTSSGFPRSWAKIKRDSR